MIKINLLPPEVQGKGPKRAAAAGPKTPSPGGSAAPTLAIALVAVVFFGGVAFGAYYVFSTISGSNREVQDLNRKVKRLEKTYEEKIDKYREQFSNWERWKDQEEILQVLMPRDRVLWSRKINMISNAIPEGVFVTEIEVQEEVRMVETQRSIKRRQTYETRKKRLMEEYKNDAAKVAAELGPEPEEVKKPEITQIMIISAVAAGVTSNDRFDRMLAFQRALEGYRMQGLKGETHRFMDGFRDEIEFGDMEATVLDGVPVWSFGFRLTTRPMFDAEE